MWIGARWEGFVPLFSVGKTDEPCTGRGSPVSVEPAMQLSTSNPWLLVFGIVAGFAIVFPLMWCFVVWLLSQIGGWSRLARRYTAGDRIVSGQRFNSVTGMVGGVSYRHVLTVHLNTEGFFIEPFVLFRIAHPRLFIPWGEVTARSPFRVLWWQSERLTIGAPKVGTITLPVDVLSQAR